MPRVKAIDRDGTAHAIDAPVGISILALARTHGLDLEGTCGGQLACATCHVILEGAYFDKLEPASDEEEDMLDLAVGVEATSRLGCQVTLGPAMEGLTFRVIGE